MSNEILNFNIIYFYNFQNLEGIRFANISNYPKFQTKIENKDNIFDVLINKICIAFNIDVNKKECIEIYIEKNENFTLINNNNYFEENIIENNEMKLIVLYNYIKQIINNNMEKINNEFNNKFNLFQTNLDNTNELIDILMNNQNDNNNKLNKEINSIENVKNNINQAENNINNIKNEIQNFEKKFKENENNINEIKNKIQNFKKDLNKIDNIFKSYKNFEMEIKKQIEDINNRINFISKKKNNNNIVQNNNNNFMNDIIINNNDNIIKNNNFINNNNVNNNQNMNNNINFMDIDNSFININDNNNENKKNINKNDINFFTFNNNNNFKIDKKKEEKIEYISIEYNKDKLYKIYLNDLLKNNSSIIEITLKNNGDTFWPNDCFIHQNINKNFNLLNNSLYFEDLPINNHEAVAPQEEINFKLLMNQGTNFIANQNMINIPFTIINKNGISLVKKALTLQINILEGDSNINNEKLYENLFSNEKFVEDGDPLITFNLNLDNLVIKLSEYNLYEKSDIYHQISPDMFDIRWNKSNWSKKTNKFRGGKSYNPPIGYIGHGLRVLNEYDNDNTWIGNSNCDGEWPVAYHGTNLNAAVSILVNGLKKGNRQAFKNDININKKGIFGEKVIGEGVYLTPFIKIADHYSAPINGYKCVLMCRVNPNKIRVPQNEKKYWILNGNFNEIRPYRLLIKKIK